MKSICCLKTTGTYAEHIGIGPEIIQVLLLFTL